MANDTATPAAGRKYQPKPDGINLRFFEACAGGTLHVQRCDSCGRFRHPPRYWCPDCGSAAWSFAPVSGAGTAYSWVTTHFTVDRGWVADVPYTNVVVELEEGPRIVAALRGMDAADLRLGLPMLIVGEAKGDDFVFFWAEPR